MLNLAFHGDKLVALFWHLVTKSLPFGRQLSRSWGLERSRQDTVQA